MEKYDKYGGNVEENLVLRVGFLKSTWPSVLSAFIPLSALYAEAENMEIDFSFSLSYERNLFYFNLFWAAKCPLKGLKLLVFWSYIREISENSG